MTPDPLLYLDAYQGNPDYEPLAIGGLTTTRMIYAFDPLPPGLDAAAQAHVLGAQVNVWTEYIPTAQHVFYMTYPRALALAEITWTAPERRDWQGFSARLGPALGGLYDDGVPFRIPNVTFRIDAAGIELPEQQSVANRTTIATAVNTVGVALAEVVPGATIRYTTDGSLPNARSPEYTAATHVDVTPSRASVITAVAYLRDGRHSAPAMLELTAASH
jgi:hexosaminidase